MIKNKSIGGEVPTNGADISISYSNPYIVRTKLKGTADYLFHRFNVEEVEAKSKASKGSKSKKQDNIESYVYRNEEGFLYIPKEQIRMAIISAAKFKQDPRSPRKSAMDIYKAGVVVLNDSCLKTKLWDYEDKRRVVIQKSAIARTRPAMNKGWLAEFDIEVLIPEYIEDSDLLDTIATAGRLCGLGDFRPTYGRFQVIGFERL